MSRYDPGIFEQVIQIRQAGKTAHNLSKQPSNVSGYVALLDCDSIDKTVLVCYSSECAILWVVDCAGKADGGYAWMINNNIAGEVDPVTYRKFKSLGNHRLLIYNIESKYRMK